MTIGELLFEKRDKQYSVFLYNILCHRNGFRTVDDILSTSLPRLTQCRGIGKKCIDFLINRLHEYGYKPAWEDEWIESQQVCIGIQLDVETYNMLCELGESYPDNASFSKIIRDLLEEKMEKER